MSLISPLCREFSKEIAKAREEKGSKYRPSLLKALARCFGRRYLFLGLVGAFEELVIQ